MALYHSVRGSVDYTIVGSPTIVDGVASGFSSSNYLSTIGLSNHIPFEYVVCFTPNTIVGTGNGIGIARIGDAKFLINSSSHLMVMYSDGRNQWITESETTLVSNTKYWGKLTYDGTSVKLQVSTDGENYTTGTTQEKNPRNNTAVVRFGFLYDQFVEYDGSIDLNHTYITVNGQPWFGICPVEVKKHQIRGPVGYTVVGNPTISSGVVSNFSSSNYLTLPGSVSAAQDFEIVGGININTSSPSGSYVPIFQSNGYGIIFCVTTGMKISAYLSSTGTSWDLATLSNFVGTTTLSANTNYLAKLKKTATAYELWIKQGNNDWILEATLSSTATIVSGPLRIGYGSRAFEGSIDLNNTYIKINRKLWFWQPQETKYIQRNNQLVWADPRLYLSGPINYEVVGTPTITDGVASEFTSVSALKINALLPDGDIEAKFDFTMGDTVETSGTQTIFSFDGLFGISKSNQGTLASWDYSANAWRTVVPASNLTAKSRYVVQCTRTGTTYSFSYSKDGGPFISSVTYNSTGGTPSTNNFIGSNLNMANRYFTGTINLNNSFVKANGELWFYGKNYASQNIAPVPSGYTFGTTTTSSIGYVDMRTQQFTAAPQGTILGRDE